MRNASTKTKSAAVSAEYRGMVRVEIQTSSKGRATVLYWNDRDEQMSCKEAVKAVLRTARWTAADLAERMRLQKRSVHNWTLGREMSVGCALQFSHVLKTDLQFEAACNEVEASDILFVNPKTPAASRSGKPSAKGGR